MQFVKEILMVSCHLRVSLVLSHQLIQRKRWDYDGCWAEIILYSDEAGVFDHLWIFDELADIVIERDLWIDNGAKVDAFETANEAIDTQVLKSENDKRLKEVIVNQSKYVKVVLK